jgi:hypothetical protein
MSLLKRDPLEPTIEGIQIDGGLAVRPFVRRFSLIMTREDLAQSMSSSLRSTQRSMLVRT